MNVGSRRSSFSPPSWLTLNRSSRNPGYDATESRRSPRDRSPGRYNDPRDADQYRAGFRGNGDRRRSIPDARSSNHGAFQANRELFTEPTRREAARDFPPRDIPRGPKASVGHERSAPHDRSLPHEAPTGPRASQPSHDFRGDSNYRGDFGFRGRGRGRGRGQWLREDSRDRGSREADRGDFRDRDRRPDERGPPPFRDDRGRDRERWDSRDQRDTFRGRRPSSPQGRGRSPNYGSRDTRDPPSNLDLDRTHRAARDAPSSTVSPSGDVIQPFGRGGFGRGRGARGRGRGFYDEYHRPPSIRSRSPEPYNINRRTLQSATPPPQVPAFGSTAAKITTPITPSQIVPPPNAFHTAPTAPATTTSLPPTVPKGPRVPVAPLARQPYAQGLHRPASSTWIRPPDRPSPELRTREDDLFPNYAPTKDDNSNHDNVSNFDNASTHEEVASVNSNAQRKPSSEPQSARSPPREEPPPKKRYPCIGRRQPTIPSPVPEDSDDDDSDSEEELNDNYFEEEIARVKADIAKVEASNPLLPPIVPVIASDWRPFIEPIVDNVIPDPCSTSSAQQEQKVEQPKEPTASVSETEPKITLDDAISPALPPAVEPVTDSAEGNIRSLVTEAVKNEQEDLAQATATNSVVIPESEDVEMADEVTQPPILVAPALPAANEESSSKPTVTSVDAQAGVEPSLSNGHPRPALESAPVSPVNALPIRVDQIAEADEDVKRNDLVANTNGHSAMDLDEPEKPAIPIQPAANGAPVRRLTIEENEGSDGSQDEQEREEELEAVRRMMKTPPLNSLPRSNTGSFWDNVEDHAHLEIRHGRTEKRIKNHIHATEDRRNSVNEAEGRAWAQRYEAYRQFTDFSQDPDAVRSRAQFAASRAKAAAEAAAPHVSSVASASAKPEGRRAHRFATERDFERVLRESEAEAKEKEQDERLARAKTASAKEATIPAMRDAQWWLENGYVDMSHRVPFNRSFALLEYGEPIDNFTPEESETFEKVYLETPKNWSRVAEALDHRDFKACIQHYYLVKHSAKLKEKASSKKKKKGRGPAKKRQTTAMSAMVENNDNAEDDQENETGGSKRRPRRAAAPTFPIDAHAAAPNESESGTPVPTPGRKSATVPKSENGSEAGPAKKKVKVARESKKQSKNNPLLAAAPMAAAARRDDSPITPVPPPIPLEAKLARNNVSQSRFPPQFDGPSSTGQAIQPQPAFAPLVSSSFIPSPAPIERQAPSMTGTFEIMPQPHLSPQPQTPQQQPLSYPSQERVGSMTPLSFDTNQASRNIQQTSSYWSVPEQNDFPALLRHFGSDWQGIAKHMTSKTHIMVYTNLFQQWLQVPSDSNKSRRVANIQTQVKNFYQRRVDNGQRDWEEMVKEADAKRERGESTGLAPTPSIIPKRRYDPTGSLPPRSGSAMDGVEGMASPGSSSMMQAIRPSQASPPQAQHTPTRFPALATAGPVPHIQPAAPASIINKQVTPQPSNQSTPQPTQRGPRGPPLGYFTANNPEPQVRPALQPRTDSAVSSRERSFQVAREAQLEQNAALRLAQEQKERDDRERERLQQQQQIDQDEQQKHHLAHQREREQRERALREEQRLAVQLQEQHALRLEREREQRQQLHRQQQQQQQQQEEAAKQRAREVAASKLKEEYIEGNMRGNLQQIEAYSTPNMRPNVPAHSRTEGPHASEARRPLLEHQQTQFQSRPPQQPRRFVNESMKPAASHREIREREMQPSISPSMHRPAPSANPLRNEQQSVPPVVQQKPHQVLQPHIPQPTPTPVPAHVSAVRQQETVRKTSNIMSLLNDDPPEARSEPPKRVVNMSATPQPPAQVHTPPPQHPLQANRFASHQPQPPTQPQAMAQSIPTQPAAHAQQPPHQHGSHHITPSPNPYAQASPHHSHHHSSSIGHSRPYTPTGFDRRAYEQPPPSQQAQQQQQQQQQMYSQPPPRQPMSSQPPIRREPSHGEMHALNSEYAGRTGAGQSSMRLKASPYTSTPPPAGTQPTRQQVGSPLELSVPGERDFYSRQPQAQYLMQQQSAAPSPQLGPTYQHPPSQPATHRLAYSQSQSHAASPPPHYPAQQPPPQHHPQHQQYRSRHNSIDGRDPRHPSTSSGSTPSHSGYPQAPTHPASMQYQPPPADRYESNYDRERRLQEEQQAAVYHQRRHDDARF